MMKNIGIIPRQRVFASGRKSIAITLDVALHNGAGCVRCVSYQWISVGSSSVIAEIQHFCYAIRPDRTSGELSDALSARAERSAAVSRIFWTWAPAISALTWSLIRDAHSRSNRCWSVSGPGGNNGGSKSLLQWVVVNDPAAGDVDAVWCGPRGPAGTEGSQSRLSAVDGVGDADDGHQAEIFRRARSQSHAACDRQRFGFEEPSGGRDRLYALWWRHGHGRGSAGLADQDRAPAAQICRSHIGRATRI